MSNNRKKKPILAGKKVKSDPSSCHQQPNSSPHLDVVDTLDSYLPIPSLTAFQSCLLIACLAIASYINSLQGNFVFDDIEAITGNKDISPNTSMTALFHHDFWGSPIDSITSHKSYRPLTVLSFKLNYIVTGYLNAKSFHLVNIILHAIICIQYYYFTRTVFTASIYQRHSHQVQPFSRAPLLAALIFTVHPIHTECVSYFNNSYTTSQAI